MQSSNKLPKREIKIFYKTENMFEPQLKYKTNDFTNEVACMVSFVPTFEPIQPQEMIFTSEAPITVELNNGSDFCFVFLVDCSGSMSGSRINTTK
jgi:hypothetical protein